MSSVPKGPGQARVPNAPEPQRQTAIPSPPPRPARAYRGFVHVTDDDVTETRRVTPEQRRAVDLLELGTPGSPLVRLSLHQWHHVDRVIAGLARMGVPAAREPEPEENA